MYPVLVQGTLQIPVAGSVNDGAAVSLLRSGGIQLTGLTLDYSGWVYHWPIDATNLQISTQHRNAMPKPPEPMRVTTRLRAPNPTPIQLGAHWINVHEAGQLNAPEPAIAHGC